MKKIIFTLSLCLLFATPLLADEYRNVTRFNQRFADPTHAKAKFDEVMTAISSESTSKGLDLIQGYFPINDEEYDAIRKQLIDGRELIIERLGTSQGFMYVKEENVKDVFIQYTYIEKFEKSAVRWVFIIYKPKDMWILNSIYLDDKVSYLFQA